jgi:hypothetical protein
MIRGRIRQCGRQGHPPPSQVRLNKSNSPQTTGGPNTPFVWLDTSHRQLVPWLASRLTAVGGSQLHLGPAPARHVGVTGKVRTAHPRPRTGLADTPSQLRFLPPGGCLAGAQYWPFVPRQLFPARSGSSPARPGPTWDGSQSDGRRRSRTPSPADCASVSRRSQQTRQPTLLHSVIGPFRTRTARSRLPARPPAYLAPPGPTISRCRSLRPTASGVADWAPPRTIRQGDAARGVTARPRLRRTALSSGWATFLSRDSSLP